MILADPSKTSETEQDLSIQEASQAFDMIERLGREQGEAPGLTRTRTRTRTTIERPGSIREVDRVARILLADQQSKLLQVIYSR